MVGSVCACAGAHLDALHLGDGVSTEDVAFCLAGARSLEMMVNARRKK